MKVVRAMLRQVLDAITGRNLDTESWYEAKAAETRASLRQLGIGARITASDVKNATRWSAQARREQLDLAWMAQARREQLDIASVKQEEENQ